MDEIDNLVNMIETTNISSEDKKSSAKKSKKKSKKKDRDEKIETRKEEVDDKDGEEVEKKEIMFYKAKLKEIECQLSHQKKGLELPLYPSSHDLIALPLAYTSESIMIESGMAVGDKVLVKEKESQTCLVVASLIPASSVNDCLILDRQTQKRIEKAGVKNTTVIIKSITKTRIVELSSLDLTIRKPAYQGEWKDSTDLYLTSLLNGMFLVNNTNMRISIYGIKRKCVFTNLKNSKKEKNTDEEDVIYHCSENTIINVLDVNGIQINNNKKEEMERKEVNVAVAYEDIGGLSNQIKIIHKMVSLPLHSPELFSNYGIQPPRGLLLWGPPGTGKTMIARAVASAANAKIFIINGPDIISKFVGESEAALKDIFAKASFFAPSLIFIDEIDSLCPKREDSMDEVEKRIVSILLTLMDGLNGMDRVVVLGATNRPNSIDPALRRPGRFDREIEIGIPNARDRKDILQKIMRKMPNSLSDDDFTNISSKMHGFVGADVKLLFKEAGLNALRAFTAKKEEIDSFTVNKNDLISALKLVRPSGLREVSVEVPNVKWTDIGGQEIVKQQIKEAVEWPLQHPEVFIRMGIRPPKGILLYGPPGCSKTLMAKAIATESGMNFIAVKGPELFSKWVGESEQAVAETFRKARAASPTVVFFDEIDSLAVHRGGGGDGGSSVGDRVLSQLLTELDGIQPMNAVVVVAATNRPDLIDSALLRPGRIDRILYVAPPDLLARGEIFKLHLKKTPYNEKEVSLNTLAIQSEGYSGAEVASLCREASLAALEEDFNIEFVCQRHFDIAFQRVKKMITKEMSSFYQKFQDKYSRG